ncbi:MAG TPA: Vms1/Ankzf1 family peptidyl-tRNA hydrolase [Actinomycetota bacterium]|jgi:peptide chain release factor subunit 1|nr:Vms1/Ankzf1 family peptidyl-tRNA hydrolase [Actinomycetota bacterium]
MTVLHRATLRNLAEWSTNGFPVVSLYLDVDGRRFPKRADYLARAEHLARQGHEAAQAMEDREHGRSVHRDAKRMWDFVNEEFDRKGAVRGLALFGCEGMGLWEELYLPARAPERIVIGGRPYLLPLETMLERSEAVCMALVDREKARLFVSALDRIEEVSDVLDEVPGWHDQGGWSQARFQRHIKEHVQRHLKHVAEVLLGLFRRRRYERLVLAGADEVVAELERELHDYVRRTIVARTSLPVVSSAGDVLEKIRELEDDLERAREREAMRRLSAEIDGGSGRAVAGMEDTIAALEEGRVETLIVGADLEATGVRCPSCGHLASRGRRCPACGTTMEQTPDLVEEAVESALRRRCRVEVLPQGPAEDLAPLGGIGALLRF